MMYSIDSKDSLNDLLQCIRDKSFVVTSFLEDKLIGKLNGQETQFIITPEFIPEIPLKSTWNYKQDQKTGYWCIPAEVTPKYDKLVYGKDCTENIVSVEVKDGQLIKFIEKNGVVSEQREEYRYWMITENLLNKSKQTRLAGEQAFKWMVEYPTFEQWREAKSKLYGREEFYCVNNLKEQAMIRNGITYFKGMKPADISVLSYDIEGAGLTKDKKSNVYCITNTFRKNDVYIRRHFYLDDYDDNTQAMINDWCAWVREINPSVVLGHNVYGYDFSYLEYVSKTGLPLGRDGSDVVFGKKPRQKRKDGSQSYDYIEASIFGREIVDTMFLAITYDIARKYESYGLKSIIRQEGLEKPDRTFVDASKIKEYYENRHTNPGMWDKVKQYAAEDSDDALKLYDLMIPSFFYFTQHVSKPYQEMILSATGSQINNMMVRSYLQDGGTVAKADAAEPFAGALSYGIPGVYRNVVKYDIASLYPSIMRHYKIYSKQKDPQAHLLHILETFTIDRLKYKKLAKDTGDRSYDDLQGSKKVGINSMYGFLGASGLNYNYIQGASDTTMYGRETLKHAIIFCTSKSYQDWKPVEEETDTAEDVEN